MLSNTHIEAIKTLSNGLERLIQSSAIKRQPDNDLAGQVWETFTGRTSAAEQNITRRAIEALSRAAAATTVA